MDKAIELVSPIFESLMGYVMSLLPFAFLVITSYYTFNFAK
jgi:hypothetical protein